MFQLARLGQPTVLLGILIRQVEQIMLNVLYMRKVIMVMLMKQMQELKTIMHSGEH